MATKPSSFTATYLNDNQIKLSWTFNGTEAVAFWLYYWDQTTYPFENWRNVGTGQGSNVRSLTFTQAAANRRYYFRIKTIYNRVSSDYLYATAYTTPAAPTGCSASRSSDTSIKVSWTRDQKWSTVYQAQYIERSTDGGSWSQVARLGNREYLWTDTTTSINHKYQYRVRAYNIANYSGYSTSGVVYTTPSAPTSCTAAKMSNTSIKVSWGMGSNYTNTWQNVYVERQTDGGSWSQVASLGGTTSSWTDTGVSAGHKYAYRVRSHNTAGYSGYATSGTIQMGQTIHAYNSSGQVKVGLVTVYDSSGKLHQVKITVYDSSGKAHNVQ